MKKLYVILMLVLIVLPAMAWNGGPYLAPIFVKNDTIWISFNGLPVKISNLASTTAIPVAPSGGVADSLAAHNTKISAIRNSIATGLQLGTTGTYDLANAMLRVQGTTNLFEFQNAGSGSSTGSMTGVGGTQTSGFTLNLNRVYNSGSVVPLENGFYLGGIGFRGWSTAAGGFNNGASINAYVDGVPESSSDISDMPSLISFRVSPDGSQTPAEKARLRSDGRFEFYGDVIPSSDGGADLGNSSYRWDTTYTAVAKLHSGSSTTLIDGKSIGIYGQASTDTMLVLTNDKDATKDSSFYVLKNGNVGIGKSPGTSKLYINHTGTSGYAFYSKSASTSGYYFELPLSRMQFSQVSNAACLNITGNTVGDGGMAALMLTAKGGNYGCVAMDSITNALQLSVNTTGGGGFTLDSNNRIGFNTSYPMSHLFSQELSANSDNGFTMTDMIYNKNVTTTTQARDTSSITEMFYAGNPVKRFRATNRDSLALGVNPSGAFIQSTDGITVTTGGVSAIQVSSAGVVTMTDFSPSYADTLTSDHAYRGITMTGRAGETLAIGDVCYLKSDKKWWLADADSAATMPGMAISTGTISANATGTFLARGRIRDDSWNLTVGGIVYPSTTKRTLTQTPPSGSGDQTQAIGIASTTKELIFTPYPILVEK
jgi:hypothetical protein